MQHKGLLIIGILVIVIFRLLLVLILLLACVIMDGRELIQPRHARRHLARSNARRHLIGVYVLIFTDEYTMSRCRQEN
jgi:hypothetical protein